MKKKIFLHGGSSLISKHLISHLCNDNNEFYIFCRSIDKTKNNLEIQNFPNNKFFFFENDISNLDKTFEDIKKLPNDLSAVFWISGYTGNPDLEFTNIDECIKNLSVNFTNIVLCINILTKKLILSNETFICVLTSVSGLRGRNKRLFNSAAKAGLISYLSGLRQRFHNKLKIITVIPGYIKTNTFEKNIKTNMPEFLISTPEKCAQIIFDGIKKNKDIIYVDTSWRIIMTIVNLIPEYFFKKFNF